MTPSLEKLVAKLSSLPSIGRKSAFRLAYHLISLPDDEVNEFAKSILDAKKNIKCCSVCQCYCESEFCPICSSQNRDNSIICAVEDSKSVFAFEDLHEYKGLYHVLQGVISPMDGITPEQLKIKELLSRIDDNVKEIIVATNPSVEGEATAMYLSRLIRPLGVKVTRLAYGLPVGATLEYADSITLSRALEGRTEV
ncbi:MAG: recombination mediator RecR [Clostridia bacterium]